MSRKLSIGVTVNLDNYENVRVDLEGDVNDERDITSLLTSLDSVLSKLGRGDPYASERVDSYRKRVLTSSTGWKVSESPQPPASATKPVQTTFTVVPPREEVKDEKCEICGTPITASQAKLSKLVGGKVTCKKCMK